MVRSGFKGKVIKSVFDGTVPTVRIERFMLPLLQIAAHGQLG
jgi:hypothetical protein